MKTQTIVTEVTHEELVNLLSTALCGSEWLNMGTSLTGEDASPDERDASNEDHLARILLEGKKITVIDYNAEDKDEFYGDLPHVWVNSSMMYDVTLEDIKRGIAKALDSNTDAIDCIRDLTTDEGCNLDNPEAEEIMQWILFGEVIYG